MSHTGKFRNNKVIPKPSSTYKTLKMNQTKSLFLQIASIKITIDPIAPFHIV